MKKFISETTLQVVAVISAILAVVAICLTFIEYYRVTTFVVTAAVALIGLYIFVISVFMLKVRRRSNEKKKYDSLNNKAEYSDMREHIERIITEQQMKMAKTPDTWEEMYHLLISAQKKQSSSEFPQDSRFLQRFGVNEDNLTIDDSLIFMLTPFHSDYENIYLKTKSVCEDMGYRLLRGDEEFVDSDLLSYVITNIAKAKLIIANIEGRNPNVFYELGIAQTMGKTTILIAKAFDNIPFDLRNCRILLYDDFYEYGKVLEKHIYMAVDKKK